MIPVSIVPLYPATIIAEAVTFERFQEADELSRKIEALYRAGKYDEAILHAKKLLETPSDARSKAQTLNSLAMLYLGKGLYDESESFLKRAMKLQEESLGVNHPDLPFPFRTSGCFIFNGAVMRRRNSP
jgi:tetratricopeptide (TPR) repeat protein